MDVSIEAINTQLESATPDVGLLIAALDGDDIAVRAWAAQVIGRVFGFGYRENSPPDGERRAAVDAVLARWGREETAEVRSTLAQTLALLGDPRARPILESALTDSNSMVRNQAAWGLKYLSVPEEERAKPGPLESRPAAATRSVDDCLLMETTVLDEDDAVRLARGILDIRLAASVQITGGVRSMSWFEGDFSDSKEWRLAIVTTATRLPELERFIMENHPYGQPTIMVSPVLGNRDLLLWVNGEVKGDLTRLGLRKAGLVLRQRAEINGANLRRMLRDAVPHARRLSISSGHSSDFLSVATTFPPEMPGLRHRN